MPRLLLEFICRILLLSLIALPVPVSADINLRMHTDLGGVDIVLFDGTAPSTVTNFMNYVNRADYDGTFIHRRASLDTSGVGVLQMGGYVFDTNVGTFTSNTGISHIPTDPPVANEFGMSNTRGTIAMARLGGQPDSATSEFFVNLVDNLVLDTIDGGFTVFGNVTAAGMAVIDLISALQRCRDIGFLLPAPCSSFPSVPLVDIQAINGAIFSAPIEQKNLVNILNIGIDTDGDGIIDSVESQAPNGGDGNSDSLADNSQQNVVSFMSAMGEDIMLESALPVQFNSVDVLGETFALLNKPTASDLLAILLSAGLTFDRGYTGFQLNSVTPGGATSVDITLPAGSSPDTYYVFGPEPGNTMPHWYEFIYDGTTGAQFNGNVITLHYVDGMRGDADLNAGNGIIIVSPGGAAVAAGLTELDGVDALVEDGAPNNGDGNGDNIPDSTQGHVASLPDIFGDYVTFETVLPQTPHLVQALTGEAVDQRLSGNVIGPVALNGLNFENGFFSLIVRNVPPGGNATVTMTLPVTDAPDTYFMFGPEPGNTTPHWYEFMFDSATGTGAVISGNTITLHFVDGGRGDADLTVNGVIADPGGPAVNIANANVPNSGGGGCSLNDVEMSPRSAGAWWLLLLMCLFYVCQRKHISCR